MTRNFPERFWHCRVKLKESNKNNSYSVINDLLFQELKTKIIDPWLESRPFAVSGTIVQQPSEVEEIQIAYTPEPQNVYATAHNIRKKHSGIIDLATDRRLLPFWEGEDYTFDLLFSNQRHKSIDPDITFILGLCKRIRNAARILENRQRKNKTSFVIQDEYDVQDLLHALIRGYLKYSVQEDPLGKVAGTKSGRADISIEQLGVLIEAKFVHGPTDQKRIFEEISQDLILYSKWEHLKTLIVLIYNSDDLRDPESLEKLSGVKEINGKRFEVQIVLV